ncbi:MAG: lipopolysaccharide biosynthesis protein, partial [Burkholderiales bacterium]
MSAVAKAIAAQGLARRAFSLGAVKALDNALQFLLPVVLVRCLDAHTFGEYRLFWLAVGTVMALATLSMPGALYYFLPRSDAGRRRLYIHQTLAFLACTGLVSALIVSPLNPWMPATLAPLAQHGALVPAFVALWVTSCLLDFLPTIEERIPLQAFATISLALARAALVAGGAWLTGDMGIILWLLLATVVLKLALLLAYIGRFHGWRRPWFKATVFGEQIRYTAPFGLSSACYVLRSQADQWVAATLFTLHSFASFSIAAILG